MVVHSFHRDEESISNFGVGHIFSDQFENIRLARGEACRVILGCPARSPWHALDAHPEKLSAQPGCRRDSSQLIEDLESLK